MFMRVCRGSHLNGVVHCLTFVVIHSVADVVLLENVIPLIIIIIIEEGFYLNSVILDLALLVLDSDALLFGHRRVLHLQKHIPQVFLEYSTILQFYTNKSFDNIWRFEYLRLAAIFRILYNSNIWQYLGARDYLRVVCGRGDRAACLHIHTHPHWPRLARSSLDEAIKEGGE